MKKYSEMMAGITTIESLRDYTELLSVDNRILLWIIIGILIPGWWGLLVLLPIIIGTRRMGKLLDRLQ